MCRQSFCYETQGCCSGSQTSLRLSSLFQGWKSDGSYSSQALLMAYLDLLKGLIYYYSKFSLVIGIIIVAFFQISINCYIKLLRWYMDYRHLKKKGWREYINDVSVFRIHLLYFVIFYIFCKFIYYVCNCLYFL